MMSSSEIRAGRRVHFEFAATTPAANAVPPVRHDAPAARARPRTHSHSGSGHGPSESLRRLSTVRQAPSMSRVRAAVSEALDSNVARAISFWCSVVALFATDFTVAFLPKSMDTTTHG
jgi:hypothetical protein